VTAIFVTKIHPFASGLPSDEKTILLLVMKFTDHCAVDNSICIEQKTCEDDNK